MTENINQKENVKSHLKAMRSELKTMHLAVTEQQILPEPDDIVNLMAKMDSLLKIIESK